MLFHLHIPKTGGTSLTAVLMAAVAPGRGHVALSEQELRDRTHGYALLTGHFDWDVLALFPEPPKVLTVLRDPIERLLSVYGYLNERAHEGVFSPDVQRAADETLTRSVPELALDPNSWMHTTATLATTFLAGATEAAAGRGLDAAIRHLDTCAWVGTTATLARDIAVLPAMLGLNPATAVPHELRSGGRPRKADIGSEAMEVLKALTESDRILYDHACAMAERQQQSYAGRRIS